MSNRILSSAAIDLLVYSEQLRARSNFLLDKSNVIKSIAKRLETLELNIDENSQIDLGEVTEPPHIDKNIKLEGIAKTLDEPDEIDKNRDELIDFLKSRSADILKKHESGEYSKAQAMGIFIDDVSKEVSETFDRR